MEAEIDEQELCMSSSDEEIELLELRREAMKTMVEKSSSCSSVGAQSEASETAANTCDEEEKEGEMVSEAKTVAADVKPKAIGGPKTEKDLSSDRGKDSQNVSPQTQGSEMVCKGADNILADTVPVSEDDDCARSVESTTEENQSSSSGAAMKAVNFSITVKDAKRTVRPNNTECGEGDKTVKEPDSSKTPDTAKNIAIPPVVMAEENKKVKPPRHVTEKVAPTTVGTLKKATSEISNGGGSSVAKLSEKVDKSVDKELINPPQNKIATSLNNKPGTEIVNTDRIVSSKKIIAAGNSPKKMCSNPSTSLQMLTRTSLVRPKVSSISPVPSVKLPPVDKGRSTKILTINPGLTKMISPIKSSFSKVNVQNVLAPPINLTTPSKESSLHKVGAIKKLISPNVISPSLRRRSRTLSINSGKIVKPMAKISGTRSLQSAAARMQMLSLANKMRRTTPFSTRLVAQGRMQSSKKSRKNNPFSKVNSKPVTLEGQAPKHPPVVFTVNAPCNESSEDEMEVLSLARVVNNFFGSIGPQVGAAVSGKHMTSMLSWKPPEQARSAMHLFSSLSNNRPIRCVQ